MIRSFWRQKKVRQNQLVEFQVDVDASALSAEGIDRRFVESVEKVAEGIHKINLKDIAFHNIQPIFLNPKEAGRIHSVAAVDKESITVQSQTLVVIPAIAAVVDIQDLNFEADVAGAAGNNITIEYTGGGTAGAEVVSVVGDAIEVQIEDGVSTAAQIKTAIDGDVGAAALVDVTLLGAGTEVQVIQAATNLEGGVDAFAPGDDKDSDFSLGALFHYDVRLY